MSQRTLFPTMERWGPWTLLAVLGALGIVLCAWSHQVQADEHAWQDAASVSVADRMLGASRRALGEHFQLVTDLYYHAGGTGRHNQRHWPDTWARRLGRKIVPREHVHVRGDGLAEMMAPLWLAIRADPHNIENYLIAVFWLRSTQGMDSFERAHDVLRQGQLSNPRHFRIRLERGLLFLREGRLEPAAAALDAALTLWPHPEDRDDPQALQDKATALTYRALLHETHNEILDAIRLWQRVLDLYPDRRAIRARLTDLAQGKPPPAHASEVWNRMIRRADREREETLCDHHHDPDHHH